MISVFIALGSNLSTVYGRPRENLAHALINISQLPSTRLVSASSIHITKPDNALGNDFANSVCKIETELNAYELLRGLQQIEIDFGRPEPDSRTRNPYGLEGKKQLKPARTLDLDILMYGDACIDSPTLTVPHPRMHERAFVLLPLAEIQP